MRGEGKSSTGEQVRQTLQAAWEDWAAWEGRLYKLHGLNLSELAVLEHVARRGPQPATRIGRHLRLTRGAMTKLANGLVKRKLVVRGDWKGDRRIVLLGLTPRGREQLEAVNGFRARNADLALSAFSASERKALADLLARLSAVTARLATPPLSPSPWGRPTRYP